MPNEPLPDDIRSVWQTQPVENTPMPLEEIRRKARRFEKTIQRRNLREYIAGAAGIAIFTIYLFIFHSLRARAGSALIIAGALFIMYQIYKRATPVTLPADLTLTAALAFHRRELMRQRHLLRTVWLWYIGPIIPGVLVFGGGDSQNHGPASWWNVVPMVCILAGIVWANHRAAAGLQHKIEELEQLEGQL